MAHHLHVELHLRFQPDQGKGISLFKMTLVKQPINIANVMAVPSIHFQGTQGTAQACLAM